jgi:hypothetical protein
MLDNSDTQAEDRQRMVDAIQEVGHTNSAIGFYWVDQSCFSESWQILSDAGIKNGVVEAGFVEDPELPTFE